MSSSKAAVCINIFSTLDAIELIKLDEKQEGEIELATSMPATIDPATRSILDIEQFSQTIRDLYDANKIPLDSPTVLVLPSLFTREIELPQEFTNDEISVGLVSEAERSYLFKKAEPEIDWFKLNETTILYSAFPRHDIENYVQVFQDNGIPLLAVDLNYMSILRGLVATGALGDDVESGRSWCLLLVTDFAFFAMVCESIGIQRTIEAPLSVGGSDELTAISEIQQDFERFAALESFGRIVLINNSTRIQSDNLISRLGFQEEVMVIEQNDRTLRSKGAYEGMFPSSLEAIGGVFYTQFPELPSMNFAPKTGADLATVLAFRSLLLKLLFGINGLVILGALLIFGVMSLQTWLKQSEVDNIRNEIREVRNLGGGKDLSEVQRKLFIKSSREKNIKLNDLMVRAASQLPDDMWLTRVSIRFDSMSQQQVAELEGGSLAPDPVSAYIKDLRTSLNRQDLEIGGNVNRATDAKGNIFHTWKVQTQQLQPQGQPAQ